MRPVPSSAALIVQAVQTSASSRTADQQNAVDWLTAVSKQQNIQSADDAGLEYAKWAGIGATAYQNELASNPGEAALQSYLSANPAPYTGGGSAGNDQFVKWGTADADNGLNSPGNAAVGNSVAEALALGGATVASTVAGVTLSSTLSGALTGTSLGAARLAHG